MKTWAKCLTALCCMIVSGASAVFPVNADSIVSYTDLTPEQTLALYGNTINGSYWNGYEYGACSFTYCYTFEPSAINNIQFSSYWSNTEKSYLRERKYLIYEMDSDSLVNNDIIPNNNSRINLTLSPSVSISGIAYYRQFIGISSSYTQVDRNFNFIANNFDYSSTPVIAYPKYHSTASSNPDLLNCDDVTMSFPYDAIGSPPSSDDGVSGTRLPVQFLCYDIYGQHIVDGSEETFSFLSQQLNFSRLTSYGWQSSTLREHHYFLFLSCPRVTDGYILPEQPETTPNYSGQLDDISSSIGANTTLLQQILAKLDLIYQRMQNDGLPNPSLTPAQTIPTDLQQYYSGIASQAPSASAVNGAVDGIGVVPFSDIVSRSGLGSLFGLLVALCAAGWVLTRGRGG